MRQAEFIKKIPGAVPWPVSGKEVPFFPLSVKNAMRTSHCSKIYGRTSKMLQAGLRSIRLCTYVIFCRQGAGNK